MKSIDSFMSPHQQSSFNINNDMKSKLMKEGYNTQPKEEKVQLDRVGESSN